MADFAPNVGAAILPSNNKPLAYYMQHKQQQQSEDALRQQQLAKVKEERNKNLNELLDFAPDKYWDPYHEEIATTTNDEVVDFATQFLNQGGKWENPEFQRQLKAKQDYVNLLANKSRIAQDRFGNVMKEINGNKYIDQSKARGILHDMVYTPDGRPLPVETLEPQKFSDVLTNPELINMNAVARDFVKALPEQVQEYAQVMNDRLGGSYVEANKITGKMLARDENGDLVTDEEGNPKINLTDEVYKLANQEPLIKTYLSQFPEEERRNLLTDFLSQYTNVESQQRITSRRAPASNGKGGVGERFNNMVDDIITTLQNAYRAPDGDYGSQLNTDAKALVPLLKGTRIGSGIVDDVRFKSGKSDGGNDRIELRVKTGTAGGEMVGSTRVIDLTDEGSYSDLLQMLQSSKNKEDILKVFDKNSQDQDDLANIIESEESESSGALPIDNI